LIAAGNSEIQPGAVAYDANLNNFSFILAPSLLNISSNSGSSQG
jgi:hypothetical protein